MQEHAKTIDAIRDVVGEPSPTIAIGLEQIKWFASALGRISSIEKDLRQLALRGWLPTYLERVGVPFSWAWAYEFTLSEQIAMTYVVTGNVQSLQAALETPDPMAELVAIAEAYDPDFSSGKPKLRHVAFVVLILLAMLRNIRAIEYHSVDIGELVARGLKGDPVALRRAVAIDPTLFAMPSVSSHVSKLTASGDKRAIKALHAAAAKGPNRQLDPNRRLRYLERVMREGSAVGVHGREAIFKLLTEQLRLYEAKKGDPFKALFTLFERWQESATT